MLGTSLSVLFDTGSINIAYSGASGVWVLPNDPINGSDNNTYTIQEFGNLFNIVSSNGSHAFAYPTNDDRWIVDSSNLTIGSSSPPPSPGWEWPMDTSRWMISSPYGPRTSPYTGFHYGIDITGSGVTGVPVWAIADGVVTVNGYNSRAGYWVEIAHNDGTWTQYMHFPTYGPVPAGNGVIRGQQIGNVGATGDSTGAHLHFQTQDTSNTAMDPIIYMRNRGHEFGEVQPT